ncbi:MAG: sulfotransferase [Planctomycetaceae bacterium]
MTSRNTSKPVRNSQGGIMLWHGMTLAGVWRLLRTKPALRWSRLHRVLSLPVSGLYNSTLAAAESLIYGRRIRQTTVDQAPLFVCGYWRSGTTLLHTLLSRDPRFQHLRMYQALFPWHFLISERLVTTLTAPFLPKARPMDNMKVAWDVPQEDDMSLCIMSQVSPMMLTAHPQNSRYFWDGIDFNRLIPAELQRWKDSLRLLLQKMTFRDSRRIVLKSPGHLYHMPLLQEMFPDARFLVIHRNPYNVFRSSVHLRRRAIDENCLGKEPFEGHEQEVINSYRFGIEVLERDRARIAPHRLYEIRYEDLEADPGKVLQQVYHELELPGFDGLMEALQPELASLKRYEKNRFDDDPHWVNYVYDELKPIFERYGYEKPRTSVPESPVSSS